jgi:nucleosome binding factor SPN SPT16 subunit
MFKRRGEITPIKNLFEKYKNNLRAPQKTVELEFIRVVGELLGIRIKEEQVSYNVSGKTLVLQVPSLIKNEIKLKQNELLAELKVRLGEKGSPLNII